MVTVEVVVVTEAVAVMGVVVIVVTMAILANRLQQRCGFRLRLLCRFRPSSVMDRFPRRSFAVVR